MSIRIQNIETFEEISKRFREAMRKAKQPKLNLDQHSTGVIRIYDNKLGWVNAVARRRA